MTIDERLALTIKSITDGAILANDLLAEPAETSQDAEDVLDAMVIMAEGWKIISESLVEVAGERLTEARNAGL